eukprot:TRINITY_DN22107_c0_g1_i1.p1 TRINITY_DN22107_c0_g1~~TRINITY_DN22107_c0_g1_i1.p1  ORF type:complete len:423 (-),score=94.69 TRINITY_DN22107_c0_g1_i1:163-1404(-)
MRTLTDGVKNLSPFKRTGTVSGDNSDSGVEGSKQPTDEYERLLERARSMDFTELKQLNLISHPGFDTAGRPIALIVQAHLPEKNVDFDRLLLYVISVMDPITEKEYSIVLVQSGSTFANRPTFGWLRKCYSVLPRKYKKNLKSLYIVHPTFWVRTTFKLFKPFLSHKFWQKLVYIDEPNDIYKFVRKDQVNFPEVVFKHQANRQKFVPIFSQSILECVFRPDHLKLNLQVPVVVLKTVNYLVARDCQQIQGLFRLSASNTDIQKYRKEFDKGEWDCLNSCEDPHVVASLLKLYLREIPEPVFPFCIYDQLIAIHQRDPQEVTKFFIESSEVPTCHKRVLLEILKMLKLIASNSDESRMTTSNLSIVFAPNLIRSQEQNLQQTVLHTPMINSIFRVFLDNVDDVLPQLEEACNE